MMTKKDLELYIHIPFCVRKCAYCDFLSGPADAGARAAYVDALIGEIKLRGEYYRDYCVKTIFLGGGTPSVLEGADTARIFHALRHAFTMDENCEITMEVNPGTVTEEKARIWKECGINRISVGLQSVNDDELKMLGRIHTFGQFRDTWEVLRKTGFANLNLDLISAIPGQTVESWERTLRTAAELHPEHISAYSLIVEEGTPFYDLYGRESEPAPASDVKTESGDAAARVPGETADKTADETADQSAVLPLPDEDTEREIYQVTEKILQEYGYHRYEISNYSREGYECRHNLGYWERTEYLGLGLGASSLIEECRFRNTDRMEQYMELFQPGSSGCSRNGKKKKEEEFREGIENLSVEDQMEEFMFLGLRKMNGISENDFRKKFHVQISDVYGQPLEKMIRLGLLERIEESGGTGERREASAGKKDSAVKDWRIRLTARGIDVSNAVFAEFLF